MKKQTLESMGQRWASQLKTSASGPLLIAEEVVGVGERWEEYAGESGGLSFTGFLRRACGAGYTLAYFRRRADAAKKIGRNMAGSLDHHVAVWILGHVPEDQLFRVKSELDRLRKENHGNPITMSQARPRLTALLGLPRVAAKREGCGRCKTLEAALVAAGVNVPAWPGDAVEGAGAAAQPVS